MEYIENRTFDEIKVGDSASLMRTLSQEDIELFAVMSGDVNPAHLDEEYAKNEMFQKVIGHGMWGGSLISTVLGTKMPGPGTVYLGQTLKFKRPVGIGDTITVTVTALEMDAEKKRIVFDCVCANQEGKPVIEGQATVLAPTEKVRRPRPELPDVFLHDRGARLRAVVDLAKRNKPVRTAVVHAVHPELLKDAVRAADNGLIDPILIGNESRVHAAAEEAEIDIDQFEFMDVEHSHAAAELAISLARNGEIEIIVQNIRAGMEAQYTQEIMSAAVREHTGIRTHRRMSHVYVMDVPAYPRPLFVTDAMINPDPGFEVKPDIAQNAIDMARILGVDRPKVALLAAINTVDRRMRTTMEASALCKMAERGQIRNAVLDGPLTYDTAVSETAAKHANLTSEVAGRADIVMCPDMESGELLAKQLKYLAGAREAGVVMGAKVPIVLANPDDTTHSHVASCALASLMVRGRDRLESR